MEKEEKEEKEEKSFISLEGSPCPLVEAAGNCIYMLFSFLSHTIMACGLLLMFSGLDETAADVPVRDLPSRLAEGL
ncbi:hypothetical protein EYF80_057914 [Liparis tanakae]|uniref:Uncharacterized protein n=1 Tax=Liparis tanakae TaxID=230148 RepID=A0A4Z2ESP2_9TELE|nr:hypothetical protein EYF80_057914 [Liparis tanakae]